MKKLTKEEIKGPDSFLKTMGTVYKSLQKYQRQIMLGVTVLVVAAVAVVGWQYFEHSREKEAQEKLYFATKKYEELQKKLDPLPVAGAAGQNKNAKGKENSNPEPTKVTSDPQKDYGPVIDELHAVIDKYPRSHAAILSAVTLANLYTENQNWEAAISSLNLIPDLNKKSGLVAGLALLSLGNVYANKGDCDSAIGTWESLVKRDDMKYFESETWLRQGQCYQKIGESEKARELYKRVQSNNAGKPAALAASRYLRLLDLSTN